MATTTTHQRDQYNDFAENYEKIGELPLLRLEHELMAVALRTNPIADARVFDLGGGSGVQARLALAAGASHIDVVDISDEMLKIGEAEEQKAGRGDTKQILYHVGDAISPLDHLGLEKHSYDVVIGNWLFDHCETLADLDGMWRNVVDYIKPGGRFIGIRVNEPLGKAALSGKYGCMHHDVKPLEDGYTFRVLCKADPPIHFQISVMKPMMSKSVEYDLKYGFEDVEVACGEDTATVKEDPAFWAEYFEAPLMGMWTGTMKK